jgi:hypothetical protein
MLSRFLIALSLFTLSTSTFAADWKPAETPLMTKWGKKVTPENAWREYPRPQLVRKDWQCLNGLWDYAITAKGAAKPEKWDGQILVPYCVESALSGVGKTVSPEQNLWYRRSIVVPLGWDRRRIILRFDAVDFEATVWVNGKELGTHRGMSDPFAFDITEALKDGRGELIVRVWDPTDSGSQPRGKQVLRPRGIWYTPVTGIWQSVWMEPVYPWHVTRIGVAQDIEKGEVSFKVGVAEAADDVSVMVEVDSTILEGLARQNRGQAGTGTGKPGEPIVIKLKDPKLWSPDSPHLYGLKVTVIYKGKPVDEVDSYLALRKISAAKDEQGFMRMMLNNKPLFQIGPLDQGWWPDGLLTPPSDEAMKYDLEVLKKIGMNMLRKHIKVEPSRLYYHCDKLGLLVWQDMPSGFLDPKQFVRQDWKQDATFSPEDKKQFRDELKAMIDHLRFFPCIVVWVPFNEGWGQHDTNDILKWVKEYDPTRLVNGPSGWTDRGYGDMKDMHMYPGPGMFPVMPDRVSVLGEFGGLGLPVKGHLWRDSKNWGYRTLTTTEELRDGYRVLMRRLHPLIGKGLAAAIYTQTTDVEIEVNGLMTYDREVIKFDVEETAKWHKALFGPAPEYRELVPTSESAPRKWRFTTTKPPEGWEKSDFDAGKWPEVDGGFGTKGTPAAVIGTEWKTPDIWIRRNFDLAELPKGEPMFRIHHDEDAEIFVNGVLAAKVVGYTTGYVEVPMTAAGRKALKAGTNTIAVHCRQTGGGQYIDVGLVEVVEKK